MADNKHAALRYETIDRCLGNKRKEYHIEELLEACNDAIYDAYGTDGIKRRQLYDDLNYMEMHYDAPILRERDGHRMVIRYSDPDFSIRNRPLSQSDVAQLKDTLLMLNRFKGMPQFEWMDELVHKLSAEFHIDENCATYVGFEQNEGVPGMKHFSAILDAITAGKNIRFRYKPFTREEITVKMSPHFLKQYNHRWYLLGHQEGVDFIPNYALDRIKGSVQKVGGKYVATDIDYQGDYFDDIVGISHFADSELEEIVLQVDDDYVGYFESNPIHGSLRPVKGQPGVYKIKVRYNYELANVIFAHADKIRIVQDRSGKLTAEVRRRWEKAGEKFF